jgi:hypothetical protein
VKFIDKLFSRKNNNSNSIRSVAIKRIAEKLSQNEIPCKLESNFVSVYEQPQIHISTMESWQHENGKDWMAHGLFQFQLNPERSDSWIVDCATGVGSTRDEAIQDMADNWFIATAPAPLSLLNMKACYNATLLSPDGPDSFPGWEGFSGPFCMRGTEDSKTTIVEHLRNNPVLPKLASLLEPDFPAPMLIGIRLFWGYSDNKICGRVAINEVDHKAATDMLLEIMREIPIKNGSATFGQFVLLMQKVQSEIT